MKYGKEIYESAMKLAGESYNTLAFKIKVTPDYLRKIVSGKRVGMNVVDKINKALEFELEVITICFTGSTEGLKVVGCEVIIS